MKHGLQPAKRNTTAQILFNYRKKGADYNGKERKFQALRGYSGIQAGKTAMMIYDWVRLSFC